MKGRTAALTPMSPSADTFEAFVGRRSEQLLSLAWLITRDPEDARDAIQDALAALYPRWNRLPIGDEFEAYLHRTVVNACLRVIRRRPRFLTVADPERLRSVTGGDDPGETVSAADQVWRLCGELNPQQRAAVVLRYFQDQTFAEIAAALGCREATARSHVRRAVARMRQQVENDDD